MKPWKWFEKYFDYKEEKLQNYGSINIIKHRSIQIYMVLDA